MSAADGDAPDLGALYSPPSEVVTKAITNHLTDFHIQYLKAATFCCIATAGEGGLDVSPRGGRPGFVHALDRRALALADWPGNNRIESMRNLQHSPHLALLFLFPGLDIFMRVNGRARVSVAADLLERLREQEKIPKSAIVIHVDEALFHCGKAINRAKLWDESSRVDKRTLPTPGAMMKALAAIEDADAATLDEYYAEGMKRDLY